MLRTLWLVTLLLAACGGKAIVSETSQPGILQATFENLPDDRITKFDLRIVVDAPPYRVWNLIFTDTHRVVELTGGDIRLIGMEIEAENRILYTWRIRGRWWLPRVTVKAHWWIRPDDFIFEQQCHDQLANDCYMHVSIQPAAGGSRTMIHYRGYMQRPRVLPHGVVERHMAENFVRMQRRFGLMAMQPAYAEKNLRYPWEELNAFAPVAASRSDAIPEIERPRVLIQNFELAAGNVTDAVMARLAGTYLAEHLGNSGRFEVVTDWDMQVMARYLRDELTLECKEETTCRNRVMQMARADYVLSGEIARAQEQFLVSFLLVDADRLVPTWRFTREVGATSAELRSLIQTAAGDLGALQLSQ
jgi:TolB-like protein